MTANQSSEKIHANLERLADNPYPGRGIIQGINKAGDKAVQVYWLMGRSESSRARVLIQETDPTSQQAQQLVRTAPYDLPEGTDTSLIIYNAMRSFGDTHVVSNGDQTDTIIDSLTIGEGLEDAVATREYEPDAPNFTPRISGIISLAGAETSGRFNTALSIVRKKPDSEAADRRSYGSRFGKGSSVRGIGMTVHTYMGDGSPLPSFEGSPYVFPLAETIEETAELYWNTLNPDNKVALVVKAIDLASGEDTYRIINAHKS